MENRTHWKKAFKSDFLSAVDLDDKEIIATIDKVIYKECVTSSGKKFCNVAIFSDTNLKPMILNVGNSKIIKKFTGGKTHLEDWKNIKVKIYVDAKVRFGNDVVEGLRIRETQPSAQKPNLIPNSPAWSKVVDAYRELKSFERPEHVYFISEENKQLIIKEADGH
jgi:hypothetical protein